MIRSITPIILIGVSIGAFIWFIEPTYNELSEVRAQDRQYSDALDKSRELQAVRDKLLSRYNTFRSADLDRLQKLLPDTVDNVRLVLDLDSMAARYGMRVRNVVVGGDPVRKEGAIGSDDSPYGSLTLSFSVVSRYDTFLAFLSDLERSLRLSDIVSVAFEEPREGDLYEYDVSIKTYWLK